MHPLQTRALFVASKAVEGGAKLYTFKATSDAVDRQGEIVTADGWRTDNYMANPVVLDSHNYGSIDAILGRCVEVRQVADGLEADIIFADTDAGRKAQALVDQGMLRAVSVGFSSLKRERGAKPGEPLRHTEKDLMEISMVPVPANPQALRLRGMGQKAADFDTALDLNERLSALHRRKWQLRDALDTANKLALDDVKLSTEGKLAAIGTNLGQFAEASLKWWTEVLAIADEAVAAGVEVYIYGAEPDQQKDGGRDIVDAMRRAGALWPPLADTKAGRKLSKASIERLRAAADAVKAGADDICKMCDECEAQPDEGDDAKAAADAATKGGQAPPANELPGTTPETAGTDPADLSGLAGPLEALAAWASR